MLGGMGKGLPLGEEKKEIGMGKAEYRARLHYQDGEVVEGYEAKRFSGLSGWLRTRMEKRAVSKALDYLEDGSLILDLPCGTGRFATLLSAHRMQMVQADISWQMIQFASRHKCTSTGGFRFFVRCEAEALPFREGAFEGVLCFRFIPHLPPGLRLKVLRELARVSGEAVIVDYRFKYAFRYLSRWIRHRLGLVRSLRPRLSLSQIRSELLQAGLSPVRWIPVAWLFSEKVVVLCRKEGGAPGRR